MSRNFSFVLSIHEQGPSMQKMCFVLLGNLINSSLIGCSCLNIEQFGHENVFQRLETAGSKLIGLTSENSLGMSTIGKGNTTATLH